MLGSSLRLETFKGRICGPILTQTLLPMCRRDCELAFLFTPHGGCMDAALGTTFLKDTEFFGLQRWLLIHCLLGLYSCPLYTSFFMLYLCLSSAIILKPGTKIDPHYLSEAVNSISSLSFSEPILCWVCPSYEMNSCSHDDVSCPKEVLSHLPKSGTSRPYILFFKDSVFCMMGHPAETLKQLLWLSKL